MRTLGVLIVSVLLAGDVLAAQDRSYLTRVRCKSPLMRDSSAIIRVKMDPPDARNSTLGLKLFRVRSSGDSSVASPALGTDSLRVPAPGLYRVWVQQIGYWAIRDTLRIGAGEAWCPVAHMVRNPLELEVRNR